MCSLLIKHGAKLNATSMGGRTFLHELCRHGRKDILQQIVTDLCSSGNAAMLQARTSGGETPIMMAIQSRDIETV